MASLERARSSVRAPRNSSTLTGQVRGRGVGEERRTSWLVMVEAPETTFPWVRFCHAALPRAHGSTPEWEKKRRSSTSTAMRGSQRPMASRERGRHQTSSGAR
ncbi:MAG: hypothetical protein BWY88_01204 [Synergistetes bacterium ADurb.Bin520]|nr:MAG: hypothetical protein BWY88_01204 [Synergistetes bacterium ADurb.Bin520]